MKLTRKERLCVRGTTHARAPHCVHHQHGILGERGREGESTAHMHELRTSRRTGYRRIFAVRAGSRRRGAVGERTPDPGPGSLYQHFLYPYIIFISSNARKRLALRPDPSILILALTDTAQAVPLGVDMNM